jgi:hypothetical protein
MEKIWSEKGLGCWVGRMKINDLYKDCWKDEVYIGVVGGGVVKINNLKEVVR